MGYLKQSARMEFEIPGATRRAGIA